VGGATGSFQLNTSARVSTLGATASTSLADITAATSIGTAATADSFDVLSLRTNSNINGTDSTDILRINNGGLIMNGGTAPIIGGTQAFTLRFGTGATTATQAEALVFVRGGQTGTSTITANFQSADFTKFGPGNLLLNGVGNTMTPVSSAAPVLRNLVVNEGTLSFAGSTSLPNNNAVSLTGVSTTSGNATVTVTSTTGLTPGMLVVGSGIPIGATVAAVTSGTAFTLSANANATATSDLTAGGTSGLGAGISGVNLVVNDSGTFNLNGQSLSFAGLGSAVITGNTNTGTITNTGANATLTFAGHTQTTTFQGAITDGTGTVALVKSGTGVLQLTGNSTYTGGTTINAGTLVSSNVLSAQTGAAAFANLASGALGSAEYQGFGTGGITLAGGTLQINSLRQFEHENADGIANAFNFGPAATNGYDITVNAANNFGSSNTTSKIHWTNSATWAAINSLTINAPAVSFDGTTDFGLFVGASTTLAGDTVLAVNRPLGLGGKVSGTGSTAVTKVGAGLLILTNSDAGANANSGIGTWNIFRAGALEVRMGDGTTSNPLVNGSTVVINGTNGLFNVRHEGNNLDHLQSIRTFQTNNLQFGSTAALTSASFLASGNVNEINLNRWSANGGAGNKSIWFNNVSVGGAITSPVVYFNGGNNYSGYVNGTTSGVKDISFINDTIAVTLNAAINLPGTLLKFGSGNLFVNADSSATHAGGTWLHAATTFFGTQESTATQTFIMSDTAKVGAGNIFVQAGAAIQFNAASNVAAGQTVDIRGNLTNYGMVRLASDESLSSFNIRSGSAYGPQPILSAGGVGQSYTRANNIGAGVLSLGSTYTQVIDLAKLGDGLWYLGSATNNLALQGSYNSSSLGAGLGNAYRLGAGGNTLNFGSDLANSNVLTDTNSVGVSNRVIIGTPAIQGTANPANGSGTVMIHTNQNYTGSTLINRGSVLDLRARLSSTVFENYGTFVLSDQGTMVNAGNNNNTATTILLRPGSELRFDNANGGLPPATTTMGRWADSGTNSGMTLDNASLRLTGSLSTDLTENVGALTVTGGSGILVQRGVQARYAQLNFASLTQTTNNTVNGATINGNNGTLALQTLAGQPDGQAARYGTGMQLGVDERVSVTGGVTLTNGMAPAWIWNGANTRLVTNADTNINTANEAGGASFVTYGDAGFVSAGWTVSNTVGTATTSIAGPTAAGPTDRFFIGGNHNAANTTTITGNLDVYALRIDSVRGDQTRTVVGAGTETITIRSGGLISSGGEQVNIRPNTLFGPTGTDVAYIHVANSMRSDSTVEGSTLQFGDGSASASLGQILASHIVKDGNGTLIISNPQSGGGFVGNLIVNAGILQLTSVATSGNDSVGGVGGSIVLNGQGVQLNLVSASTSAVTFQNNVLIGENNPLATIANTTGTSGANVIGNLTFGGITNNNATPESREQGQTLQVTGVGTTSLGLRVAGTTDLGPVGNVVLRPNTDAIGNITLAGQVTGAGTLIASQSGGSSLIILNNVANGNNWSGGTVMMGRTLEVWAQAPDVTVGLTSATTLGGFGTGAVTILGGQLNLRVDGTGNNTVRDRLVISNAFDVRSNFTLDVNRTGLLTTNANKNVRLSNFTIGSQVLTVNTGGNGYNLELGAALAANSGLFLTGTPTINNTMDTVLFGVQDGSSSGNAVGNYILKNSGAGRLWIGDNTSTFTGGIVNNVTAAEIRFGDNVAVSTTAQAGTGTLRISNGAVIRIEAAGNFATGQQVSASSVPLVMSRINLRSNITPNGSGGFDFISSSSSGILSLETGATYSNALQQANIGNGRMWIGADFGAASYTANTLGAGATTPYDSASTAAIYRLGGGQQVLTLAPTTAGANVLTGATTKLYVGNLSTNTNVGSLRLNNTNNYGGGTVILPVLVTGTNPNTLFIQTGGSGSSQSPLGTGQVDVFGTLVADTANCSFINTGNTGNQNVIVTHPGGILRFDNTTNNNNRWFDTTALALDGATFSNTGPAAAISTETFGALSFDRGSRIALAAGATGQVVQTFASLAARGANSATLTFLNGGTGRLGLAAANTSERVIITTGAPTPVTGITGTGGTSLTGGMLPGYYIAGSDGTFVTYGANGFSTVPTANMVDAPANFNSNAIVGTSAVNVSASTTLTYDTSLFALRVGGAFNVASGAGRINTLTFAEQGVGNDMGGILLTGGDATISTNLKFGSGATAREALIYTGAPGNAAFPLTAPTVRTLTMNADIVQASQVTKFGPGTLVIAKDQYNAAQTTAASFNWVVNEGVLQLNTFGASGTGNITLNGSGYSGTATTALITQLNLRAQNLDARNLSYTMGALNTVDNVIIDWDGGQNDTISTIGAINVTNTATGAVQNDVPARLRFNFASSRLRSYLQTGTITLNGTTALDVNWGTGTTNGTQSGVIAAGLAGSGNLIKWGAGVLYVRGSNTGFTGNTFIEQGAVSVLDSNALGNTIGQTVTVRKYGVLDIGISDFTPTNVAISYETGGVERWSVNGARDGTATLNLNGGTLQIAADQTNASVAAMTVNLTAGGGIEGFLSTSDAASNNNNVTGAFRTVGSNVAFNLTGGVTLGQNLTDGINGLDNGRGQQQAGNNLFTGVSQQYQGVVLELKGAISGTGSLTKQGFDIVTLSGANTYSGGTTVFQGVLRTGATNALGGTGGNTGDVTTRGEGVLDLNGFNQTVRHLTSPASTVANTMGFVTNSAYDTATLTVGNSSTANFTYGGTIENNLKVVKSGTHVFKVTGPNTYIGGTDVNAGWMETQNTSGSGTGTGTVTVQTAGTLAGGNITGTTGMITGFVNLKAGGTLSPGAVDVTGSPVSLGGTLKLGSLKIDGGALTFQLSTPGSTTDDLIALTGTDFTSSSVLNITAATSITILELGTNVFNSGYYDLISYAGGTRTGFSNLTLATGNITNGNGNFSLSLFDDTANNRIQLFAQSNTTLIWKQPGGADSIWDTGTHAPKNWVDLSNNPADWAEALDAVFNDSATGFTPTLSGTVTPASIQFNNTTTYTLGGSGVIAGTGALSKINTGKVIINAGNSTFSGGTTLSAGTIEFGASTTDGGGFVTAGPLGTGIITVSPTSSATLQADATNRAIANSVIIGGSGNVNFNSNGGGILTFGQGTSSTGSTTTLSVNTNMNVASGVTTIFGQPVSGSGKTLTKSGAGTLIFMAVNTYNAGTNVSEGTLNVTSTGSLSAASNITIGASGTTTLGNASQSLGTAQVDGILNLNGVTPSIATLNGAPTGDINLGSGITLTVTKSTTDYAGTIDGTGGILNKTGISSDDLTLTNGNSTYTGGTTLNAGSLSLGASSTVAGNAITNGPIGTGLLTVAAGTTVNGANSAQTIHNSVLLNGSMTFGGTNLTFSDSGLTTPSTIALGASLTTTIGTGVNVNFNEVVTDGASIFNLTKAGGGTLTLTKADNTYSGITAINVGTLAVTSLELQSAIAETNADSLGNSSNAAANLVIGATLQYIGTGSTTDRRFTVATGATIDASGTGSIVFNNTAASAGTAALTLTGSNTANNEIAANLALGANGVTKSGAGTWFLSGVASTYTGATTINAGVLRVNLMANGGVNSSIGASTNVAANFVIGNGATFSYVGSTTSATDRVITLGNQSGIRAAIFDSSGTGVVQFTSTADITGTGTTDNSRTLEFTGTSGSNATPNQFSLGILDRGTGFTSVIKNGTGVWRLNGNSRYQGTTSIQSGTLIINAIQNGAVGAVATPSNIGASTNAATNLLIGSATTNATLRFEGSGNLHNRTDRLFTVGAAGGTVDASGASGTPLSFTNTGALTMAGTNTARPLILQGTNADTNLLLPTISNNGTAAVAVTKTGTGTWALFSTAIFTGNTTNTSAVISNLTTTTGLAVGQAVSGTGIPAGAFILSIDSATQITLSQAANQTNTGVSLTYTGNGGSAYTGATTINGGTLKVNNLANGGSNSNIGAATVANTNLVIDGGTLEYAGTASGSSLGTTNRLFTIGDAGATISSTGTGAVNFNGTGNLGVENTNTAQTFTLTGTNTGANNVSGNIVDNGTGATSVTKSGVGTWQLAGTGTYTGNTLVTAGTLNLATGGSINDTQFIRVDTGATFGAPAAGYTTDATVAGTGTINNNLIIGSNVGAVNSVGVLKPGNSTGGLLANAGDSVGTLTFGGNLTLAAATGGADRLVMQLGATGAADFNDSANILAQIELGTLSTYLTNNAASWENGSGTHDRLTGAGTLSLTNTGRIKVYTLGYAPVHGDIFDLLDWSSITGGSFDLGGGSRGAGLFGDLDLPNLSSPDLAYDTSLFFSNGILVIVPEPSRMLLLMFGLLGLFCSRRRRYSRL
jgi:autotransporter-associated beta strand protein